MAIGSTLLDNGVVTSSGPWTTLVNVVPTGGVVELQLSITTFGGGTAPSSLAASGCGLAWTAVNNIDNSAALTSCWMLKGLGTGTSGTITITPTGGSSLKEANYSVIDHSGMDTAAPIVQSVTGTAASANPQTLAITLAALGDAVNNAVSMATGGGSTATPGSGYTELSDLMNNVSLETQWKLPGTTTPSCTGDSAFFGQAGIAVEWKAAPAGGPPKLTLLGAG